MQLLASTKSMSGVYFIVHMVPLLIKYKKVLKKYEFYLFSPSEHIKKAFLGYSKSMMFVAATLFLLKRTMCLWCNLYKFQSSKIGFISASAPFTGLLCAFPLLLESPGRQVELSLYVFNKGS